MTNAGHDYLVNNAKRILITALAVVLVLSLFGVRDEGGANNDWQAPIMADYVKVPPFISFEAKPNIMIMLDNSGSMNAPAYDLVHYAGEPYNGIEESVRSFFIETEADSAQEFVGSGGTIIDENYKLYLGHHLVGMRFTNLDIPQGAVITEAYIRFTSLQDGSDEALFEVFGEASDDAALFLIGEYDDISEREQTTARVTWSIEEPWYVNIDPEQPKYEYDTPDLKTILQEIVSRPGWRPGNAMVLAVSDGTGSRVAEAHKRDEDDDELIEQYGPVLHVKFESVKRGQAYYGYFNPEYFYEYRTVEREFRPKYQKINFDYSAGRWNVRELNGAFRTLTDADIAPANNNYKQSQGLWDGNWANWLSMRRIDVMRKVLVGGKADPPLGNNNGLQKLIAESPPSGAHSREYSKTFSSNLGPATSPYKGNYTYRMMQATDDRPLIRITYGSITHYYTNHIRKDSSLEPQDFLEGNLAGVLQRVGDRARWGNMWFNQGGTNQSGGKVSNPIANGFTTSMLENLQTQQCNTWTPLAESFYVAMQYFKQESIHGSHQYPTGLFQRNNTWDPFYDNETEEFVPCAKSFVLLLTDGASTMDGRVPIHLGYASDANNIPDAWQKYLDSDYTDAHFNPLTSGATCNEGTGAGCIYPSSGHDYLADLALYARHNDLRPDLAGWENNIVLYTVLAFGGLTDTEAQNAAALLKKASLLGGHGDTSGDGIPDTYYQADDGYLLERELLRAISDMLARSSSGTAASVVSGTRSGEGAVYQSVFHPHRFDGVNTVAWAGQVNGLLVDAYGNLREDTTGDSRLVVEDDLFVFYCDYREDGDYSAVCAGREANDYRTFVRRFRDVNGNGRFDAVDLAAGPVSVAGNTDLDMEEIRYLWTTSEWLNSNDLNPVIQRPYASSAHHRHIFTFVDADGAMVPNTTNIVKDFIAYTTPTWEQITDPEDFFAYLHVYEPFDPPDPFDPDTAHGNAGFRSLVARQAERIVNYIRGQEQPSEQIGGINMAEFRNRRIVPSPASPEVTWRLGDIVHSSPTVVGRPAENFDLIYRDSTYTGFYRKYRHRRNVLYAGSNGGMLHAFNAGFYNEAEKQFVTLPVDIHGNEIKTPGGSSYNDLPLGSELWAYVPFNLLPHLYWLTKPDYEHVFYMDLEPRIFDARIFEEDDDHPNGWGTVLVAGMNFGGGKIAADLIKGNGPFNPDEDRVMSSAYAIFDITNPEEPPRLLAELTFPELGFTTCHPGVILMRDVDDNNTEVDNQWYLIFGSGPVSGDAFGENGANTVALADGTSTQQAVMYAVDLVALAQGELKMVTPSGLQDYSAEPDSGPYYLVQFDEPNSSVSKPIVVDWDMDYKSDTVYFGISSGDHDSGLSGRMRRFVLDDGSNNPLDPTHWDVDNILFDAEQPIMAPATATVDKTENRWVYFGTGRFVSQKDKHDSDQRAYYGIKEPYVEDANGNRVFTYDEVDSDDVLDVSNIDVYEEGAHLNGYSGTFWDLADEIEDDYLGWRLDFPDTYERNLGQAVLAGEALTFTTFTPSDAVCASEGQSHIYALYYRTGTAYMKSVIGLDLTTVSPDGDPLVLKRQALGPGMTITPNIHVGRQKGAMAFVQTESGSIENLEQETPGSLKSGRLGWMPDSECP